MGERLTYTVPEAAIALGVSARLVYDMASRGDIQSIRLGRRVVIPRIAVDRLLEVAS